jgi:hypothetical protein
MRQALYRRFRLGVSNPGPRPIVGSEHVAGGFIMPALFGCEIRFEADAAPTPVPRDLGAEEALAITVPDIATTWPMSQLIADLDSLESQFGWACGDFDLDGVLNTALQIRGQQFFMDFYEAPQLAHHVLSVVTGAQIAVGTYMRARTGTLSLSTNRSTVNVDPAIFLHSNCSVQMVSPQLTRNSFFLTKRGWRKSWRPTASIIAVIIFNCMRNATPGCRWYSSMSAGARTWRAAGRSFPGPS